ncbi:hypothetical protein JWG42_15165 [Desulfoprunum benzoelyticum]|uniref:Uncharacterized protein n=1 Tax=Desulfoprunum benzoelyticum TaxID=1506996 RepID=A0A840UXQ4_9BACT|nr:hypothetical protein [Desulfoprunum benzoelyticum]MBB5349596.1 hypothetical protein [Desulfoprunum benzoelyticum]MBM9531499.1 hypothetical protein [Desulfoprunum benzoelyticum]
MDKLFSHKAALSFVGIVVAVSLFFIPTKTIPIVDQKTDQYFNETISKAGLAYATVRAINASVSVIKESNLQLEPAGIGVSLAIGQILDPVDDMTERLSTVLVTAITSLGVQKLSYEIGISLAPTMMAALLVVFSILLWFDTSIRIASLQSIVVKLLILIAVVRFCLPLSSLANDYIYTQYFEQQISQANDELRLQTKKFDQLENLSLPESHGILGAIETSGAFIKQKSLAFKNALQGSVTNMSEIIENLLKLTFLYVGIFFLQVVIFPVTIFWILLKAASSLFNARAMNI